MLEVRVAVIVFAVACIYVCMMYLLSRRNGSVVIVEVTGVEVVVAIALSF